MEQRAAIAADAVVASDEYVLLRNNSFRYRSGAHDVLGWCNAPGTVLSDGQRSMKGTRGKPDFRVSRTVDTGDLCNYYRKRGNGRQIVLC